MNKLSQAQPYRVIADYDSPYTEPFFLKKGATVQVGCRDDEWPGWVWCTTAAGESRWVPESYLDENGRVTRDYESTELTVNVGEWVTAVHEESGWLWCTNQSGQQGWVPLKILQLTQSDR